MKLSWFDIEDERHRRDTQSLWTNGREGDPADSAL
jgi:hypothetical protein